MGAPVLHLFPVDGVLSVGIDQSHCVVLILNAVPPRRG